jgi:amino acid transporter
VITRSADGGRRRRAQHGPIGRDGRLRRCVVADAKRATGSLHRSVGLTSLMFISLGSIIGSGWLLGALTAAKAAGGASLISWVLAGVIIILLALVHAELGAAYPLAGGTARFPRLAFGSIAGFTAGWVAWLQAVTIAPIEVEAALSYLDHIWPEWSTRTARWSAAASSWPSCSCSSSRSSTWRG